jgi:hypothetical protein
MVRFGGLMRRSWFLGILVFLAACGEEPKAPVDWVIHPDVQGKERAILRAALQVVFEECPDLKKIDWEAVAKKEGGYAYRSFFPAKLLRTDFDDFMTSPHINDWKHHARFGFRNISPDEDWDVGFSWEEPPGIATEMYGDRSGNALEKQKCNFNERRTTHFAKWQYRDYFFKRVDRLAEVVKEVEATYKD